MTDAGQSGSRVLLCRVEAVVCALPLENVSETMRPLPLERIGELPGFIDGLSIIRGKAVPVIDLARLLGSGKETKKTRLVLIKIEERNVALSVDAVIGIRTLENGSLKQLSPLLRGASAEFVRTVGSLDAQLLIVLESSRIVPAAIWAQLQAAGVQA
jgi:purine-binding chemotaxis protein CheW